MGPLSHRRRRTLGPKLELALLAGATGFIVSCGSLGDAGTGEASTAWSVSPTPVLDVGELDGHPHYIFSRIGAVEILPGGRIAVADADAMTIRVYSADGLLQAEMGAPGEGPGEFQSIVALELLPPDTILAYDSSLLRITKLGMDGSVHATVQIQADGGYPEVYAGRSSSGDHVIAWIRVEAFDDSVLSPDLMEVGRFGPDGALLGVMTTMPGMRRFRGPVPFSPHFAASMIGDRLYMTDGMSGRIRVVDLAGGPESATRVALEPPDLGEAWRRLEATLAEADQSERLDGVRETAPDSIPVFSDMLADDEGHLWLKRYDAATDSHLIGRPRNGGTWVVADPDGSIRAEVAVPPDFRLVTVRDGLLAGIARDSLGVESVRMYRLVRD